MSAPGEILANTLLKPNYYQVKFYAPEICAAAQPGQFVHVRIAHLGECVLRRPFSINNVEKDGTLTVTYKVVGKGTAALAQLPPGTHCELLGPLGHGYTLPEADEVPVMVAGGYGAAALFLIARRSAVPGILLLGARSEADLILAEEYRALGTDVRIATEDGSVGTRGRVTALLPEVLKMGHEKKLRFYGCGPRPMLRALGEFLQTGGYGEAELSLDHRMCCGVGACFACVVQVRDGAGFRYARSCAEGPVFKASDVYWEEEGRCNG